MISCYSTKDDLRRGSTMYYAVQYCTTLVLCCTTLLGTTLHYAVLRCTTWQTTTSTSRAVQYCTTLVLRCTTLYHLILLVLRCTVYHLGAAALHYLDLVLPYTTWHYVVLRCSTVYHLANSNLHYALCSTVLRWHYVALKCTRVHECPR